MEILLLNPPTKPNDLPDQSFIKWLFSAFLDERVLRIFGVEALGLGYLASHLRQYGVDVDVLDACLLELTVEECLQRACKKDYEIIGISGTQAAFHEIRMFSEGIRNKGFKGKIILGGEFATLNAERILKDLTDIDFIIRGEGEESLLALVETIGFQDERWKLIPNVLGREGGDIVLGPKGKLNLPKDKLSRPARDHARTAMEKSKTRTMGVFTSAGCAYGRCSFCSPGKVSSEYDALWVPRAWESVVGEIVETWEMYKPEWISLVDTDFLGRCEEGKIRGLRILRGCKEKGVGSRFIFSCRADEVEYEYFKEYKRYGAEQVFVGFESFVGRRLKLFNKGVTVETNKAALRLLTDLGIHYIPGHILFDPYMDYEDVRKEIDAYREMDYYALHKLTKSLCVLPETPLWHKITRDQLLSGDYTGYSYAIRDIKAQTLRSMLYKLQISLHPFFIKHYELHPTWEFSPIIRKNVKSVHLEIADALYEAIGNNCSKDVLESIITIGFKQMKNALNGV